MKEKIEKTESAKIERFSVIVDKVEVLNTSKEANIYTQIFKLQEELKPLIIKIDHEKKKSFHYVKTIHQRNYRIQAGNYEKDSVLKPAPEVTQTED